MSRRVARGQIAVDHFFFFYRENGRRRETNSGTTETSAAVILVLSAPHVRATRGDREFLPRSLSGISVFADLLLSPNTTRVINHI